MLYIDFIFWLKQQPPENQKGTILAIIGEFVILFIIGIIAEQIKRKSQNHKNS